MARSSLGLLTAEYAKSALTNNPAITARRTAIGTQSPVSDHGPTEPTAPRVGDATSSTRVPLVLGLTFFSGMSILAVEITASRLLAPFFGTSTTIWAVVIGLTLLYLSIGYWIGGQLADRSPRESTLTHIIALAAFLTGLVPFIAGPILEVSSAAISNLSGGLFLGSFVGVLLLFSVPLTMLGMVSPFAIRLVTVDIQHAGRRAGQVYAVSTFGSIAGAFLPVLTLVPTFGTRLTFLLFAWLLLGLTALAAHSRLRRCLYIAFGVCLLILWLIIKPVSVRSADGLVWEGESALQFIQVIKDPSRGLRLVLNEGIGTHSIYNPDRILTEGPWDYFLLAPLVGRQSFADMDSLLIIGLGAGTVSKQFTTVYGPTVQIDGVELDPKVIELGQQYFDMTEQNLTAITADGRTYLQHSANRYNVIAVDAYRQPYIPFHLVTREFFEEARSHLSPNGVLALNAGRTKQDFRLVEALSSTMKAVFPHVYVIDLPTGYNNSLIYGTIDPITDGEIRDAARATGAPALAKIVERPWLLRSVQGPTIVYTDDLAPVERLIDDIIVREALGGAHGRQR